MRFKEDGCRAVNSLTAVWCSQPPALCSFVGAQSVCSVDCSCLARDRRVTRVAGAATRTKVVAFTSLSRCRRVPLQVWRREGGGGTGDEPRTCGPPSSRESEG